MGWAVTGSTLALVVLSQFPRRSSITTMPISTAELAYLVASTGALSDGDVCSR